MDLSALATNLDLEDEEFIELVEVFLETTMADVAKLESAFSIESIDDACAAAHSIKGAAGSLGFEKTHELAARIEMNARQQNLAGSQEDSGAIRRELAAIDQALKAGRLG